jgi:hypothetical protein
MSLLYSTSPKIKASPSYNVTRNVLMGDVPKDTPKPNKKYKNPFAKLSKRLLRVFLNLVIVIAITTAFAIIVPKVIFSLYAPPTITVEGEFTKTALGGSLDSGAAQSSYIPPFNPNLPEGDWLEIPLIGVRGQYQQTEDPNDTLDSGIWLDPKYGKPGDRSGLPIIMAAHRYGWKWWWKDDYWKYNSFYNLPETKPGDIIEITSGQRKYLYEIYAADEGEQITDINADLILYTCKHLDSSIRHFRYARLIDPTQDSQTNSL